MNGKTSRARAFSYYPTPCSRRRPHHGCHLGKLRKRSHPGNLCDDVARATTRGGAESSVSSRGVLVQRVIDGDTVVLANGDRVRYIGMDTPERGEPFFDEATEFNRRLVEGRRVRLMKDESDKDRFGRLLRYAYSQVIYWSTQNLVREGLAEGKRYEPDVKFANCFDGLMQEARDAKRGMWEP